MASKAYEVVDTFEKVIAEYSGSKYAVAVESCTAALLLACAYLKVKEVEVPRYTYPSVPCSVIHGGGTVKLVDREWSGVYMLYPYPIIDGALRFKRGMYRGGFHCLSFHSKKLLPIGRGGMILTDDEEAYKWFKKARFDGRDEVPLDQDKLGIIGWNCYLQPEQAARGLQLFDMIKTKDLEDIPTKDQGYPDLKSFNIYE